MKALLRSRWFIGAVIVVIAGVLIAVTSTGGAADDESSLTARVTRGDFKVVVTTAGELRAKNFVQITAPPNADRAGAYQMKISKLVPEGTVVKQGDFVAELDRSVLANQMQNVSLSMARSTAVAEQAKLDTTLNLSKAREDLRNMEVALEERRIAKEQARYEAPSIQRQAQIDYEKAERMLAQGKLDYVTRNQQALAKMREVNADLDRWKVQTEMINTVMEGFTIKAPADGMVIYLKEWSGKKKGVGGQVSPWEGGTVATLPDLSKMESFTYVNEIDVRRVSTGQLVALSLDSDPDKKLTGKVVSVANVGEERPNSDAKVFEVKIEVIESDTTLRPGMTTGNVITTMSVKSALSIPLEAVTSENNIPFVFKRTGGTIVKQEIETGALNDTHVVVTKGVEEDDVVLLVPPVDHAKLAANRLPGSTAGTPTKDGKGGDAAKANPIPVKPGDATRPNPTPVKPGGGK